ncbi:transposable element Tc3 transposase [Trichonephila clavipes]|nr:transposable element Tc3 transposase [Trichonephila clavipes]
MVEGWYPCSVYQAVSDDEARQSNDHATNSYGSYTNPLHFTRGYGDRFNSCQVIYSQFGLAIHQNDHQARRRFVEWAQNEIAIVPDFHKRILFSDEAHFWLNGYVNKQNCRIWSEANPQVYVETPLHPEKLTVWCALWAGGIIGPYFFKNDKGHNVTVNGVGVTNSWPECLGFESPGALEEPPCREPDTH